MEMDFERRLLVGHFLAVAQDHKRSFYGENEVCAVCAPNIIDPSVIIKIITAAEHFASFFWPPSLQAWKVSLPKNWIGNCPQKNCISNPFSIK